MKSIKLKKILPFFVSLFYVLKCFSAPIEGEGNSISFKAQIQRDHKYSSAVTYKNGISTVKIPGGYVPLFIPLGNSDGFDLSIFTTLTIDYKGNKGFRYSLSDRNFINLKEPGAGGEEWTQWEYIGDGSFDGKKACDLSNYNLEKAMYLVLSAAEESVIQIKEVLFTGEKQLKFVAQNKIQMETGNKVAELVDLFGIMKINFLTNSGTVMLPLGNKNNYNLSQYEKLYINAQSADEIFVSLYTYRAVNIQENKSWKLKANSKTVQEISLADINAENLTNVAYIGLKIDGENNGSIFLKEIYFTGDASKPKLKGNPVPNILTVDCSQEIREATHCASGSLYGVTDSKPIDVKELIEPLNPCMFTNPALSENGCQWPFGDAIKTAERIKNTTATVTIRLADIYPGWPYRFTNMKDWFQLIDKVIKNKKDSGLTNFYGYEIWNEPDLTWKSTEIQFEDFWKQTYDYLRSKDPNVKIIGPSYAIITKSRIKNFYKFCLENNCMPDIVCWHELTNVGNTANTIKMYRQVEQELGISELPITINEYSDGIKEREGCPGASAAYIGKFERYKIDSACISWWFTANSGCLGSLLTPDFKKGAGWYFYKWYGEMNGNMLFVNPVNENSKYADGAASYNKNSEIISCIFGGANDGTIQVDFTNVPEKLRKKYKITVEKIEWESRISPSEGSVDITLQAKITQEDGKISVSIDDCDDTTGYRILLMAN